MSNTLTTQIRSKTQTEQVWQYHAQTQGQQQTNTAKRYVTDMVRRHGWRGFVLGRIGSIAILYGESC